MGVLDDFSPAFRALVDDESKLPAWVREFRATRIEFGASAEDAEQHALMVYAAKHGDAALAERLLKAGSDPDAVIPLRDLALCVAVENGNLEIAHVLIAAGADVNNEGCTGTPLRSAAERFNIEMTKLLRAAGATSSGKGNEKGDIQNIGECNSPTGAFDMSVLDDFSPKFRSMVDDESKLPPWVAEFRATRMEFGASAEDAERQALMVYAAKHGDAALAERLLKAGVDPDAIIYLGDTALCVAVENGQLNIARVLIAAGADVNKEGRMGTPLRSAAGRLNVEMTKLLRAAGAISSGEKALAEANARAAATKAAAAITLPDGADFDQAVAALEQALGTPPRTEVGDGRAEWDNTADGSVGFVVTEYQAEQIVMAKQDELLRAGCFAFSYANNVGGGCLALMRTTNPIDAVRKVMTEGPNWGISNDAIIAWLESAMKKYPMRLVTIGEDKIDAQLLAPVRYARKLANSIIDICPTWQDDGVEKVVEVIKQEKEIRLWWD
jgi:ankyrin repeat protein